MRPLALPGALLAGEWPDGMESRACDERHTNHPEGKDRALAARDRARLPVAARWRRNSGRKTESVPGYSIGVCFGACMDSWRPESRSSG